MQYSYTFVDVKLSLDPNPQPWDLRDNIHSPRDNSTSLNQQSLKQRVNMVVMRMIAQNSDQDQRSGMVGGGEVRAPVQQVSESRESIKYRTLQVSRVVVNVKESMQVVEEIMRAGQPIGLDGEGVNLGPKGKHKIL